MNFEPLTLHLLGSFLPSLRMQAGFKGQTEI